MDIDKKIYKFTSIIALMIAIVLLANLIIPKLTMAGDIEPSSSKITLNEIAYDGETTLTISGSVLAEYTTYDVYVASGSVTTAPVGNDATNEQKQAYYDSLYDEFTGANNVETFPSTANTGAAFSLNVTIPKIEANNVTYKVLCIAKKDDSSYALAYTTKTFNIPEGSGTDEGNTTNETVDPSNEAGNTTEENNNTTNEATNTTEENNNTVNEDTNTTGENNNTTNEVTEPSNETGNTTGETDNQAGDNQQTGNQTQEEQTQNNENQNNENQNNQATEEQTTTNQTNEGQTTTNQVEDDEIHVNTNPTNETELEPKETDLTPVVEPEKKTEQQPVAEKTTENTAVNATTTGTTPATTNTKPQNVTIENNNSEENIPQTGSNDTILISAIITLSILSLGSFVRYKTMK